MHTISLGLAVYSLVHVCSQVEYAGEVASVVETGDDSLQGADQCRGHGRNSVVLVVLVVLDLVVSVVLLKWGRRGHILCYQRMICY